MKIEYIIIVVVLIFCGIFNFDAAKKKIGHSGCLWHGLMSGICFGMAMTILAFVFRVFRR